MNRNRTTQYLVRVGVLAALGFGLMLIEFPLLPGATFLKYDPSELPVLVGTFALGPMAGIFIELIKNVLYLLLSGKGTPVGAAANLLAGIVMVTVAGGVYWHKKTRLTAALALLAGSLAMTVVMAYANMYVFLPLWGVPGAAIPQMVWNAVTPFNLLKSFLTSAVTFLAYKRVRGYLALEARPAASLAPQAAEK